MAQQEAVYPQLVVEKTEKKLCEQTGNSAQKTTKKAGSGRGEFHPWPGPLWSFGAKWCRQIHPNQYYYR